MIKFPFQSALIYGKVTWLSLPLASLLCKAFSGHCEHLTYMCQCDRCNFTGASQMRKCDLPLWFS